MPSLKPLIRLVALNVLLATLVAGAAEAAPTTYTLAWNANTESDVTGYVLSWGTAPGGPYSVGSQSHCRKGHDDDHGEPRLRGDVFPGPSGKEQRGPS